jgi:hypothetical protein
MYNNVVVNIASYPRRVDGLRDTLYALAPQVNEIRVFFNDYTEFPEFFHDLTNRYHKKVRFRFAWSKNDSVGDRKAAGKFFFRPAENTYQFYVDDDLEYPSDYVQRTITYLNQLQHQNRCFETIASYHGVRFTELPCKSYFYSHSHFPYNMALDHSEQVHVPGTGTTAVYVTDRLVDMLMSPQCQQDMLDNFTKVDLVLAKYLSIARIPVFTIPRTHFYLKLQERFLVDTDCIYNKALENEVPHVAFINSVNWRIIE